MARVIRFTLLMVAGFTVIAVADIPPAGSLSGTVTAKGLVDNADIVVSLEAPGLSPEPPSLSIDMDQRNYVFVPHVLPVVRGTTVRFLNSDAVAHSVFSPDGRYDLGSWPQGQTKEWTFRKAGVYTQLCHQHPEMHAYIVVLDTPYFATTAQDGAFQITNVPAGQYTLVAWSERLSRIKQPVTIGSGTATIANLMLTR